MQLPLRGWLAIAIALSIAWALAGGVWGYRLGDRWNESAREDAVSRFYQCLNDETLGAGSDVCQEREREIERIRAYQWPAAALVGLAPLPIAWLAAYLAIGIARRKRREIT